MSVAVHSPRFAFSMFALGALLVAGCGGSGSKESTSATTQGNTSGNQVKQGGWTKFDGKAEKYTILFPGTPTHTVKKDEISEFVLHTATFVSATDKTTYHVMYHERHKEGLNIDPLDILADLWRLQPENEIKSKKDIKVSGADAIDMELEKGKPGNKTSVFMRNVVTKTGNYEITVSSPVAQRNEANAMKFLNSFQLTK
jgi:hypothetical protein